MKFFILTICLFGTVFAENHPMPEWKPLPVDDPTVIKLADLAVVDINAKENSSYYNKLVQIRAAKSRLMSGIEYELRLDIQKTDCPKSKPYTDACQINVTTLPPICTVHLHEDPGSKEIKITAFQCDSAQDHE
ncbi:cystatin-like [Tetranychus urticae]|uniref:Cystatin domain-containing protein n=1 Tax=Tetranychus urticae TaxID=32264 RepID=T1JW07_TETUR|nr:cystatin-like [Tetranychus urticae]